MAYTFRGLVHFHHSCMQADMVLDKFLRVLHLDLKETRSCMSHWEWLEHYEASKPAFKVTHFLWQCHTYSNKAIPPKNITPFGSHVFFKSPQSVLDSLLSSQIAILFYFHYIMKKEREWSMVYGIFECINVCVCVCVCVCVHLYQIWHIGIISA